MNKLNETYKKKGLSIVGVTSEPRAKTDPWIAKHKVSYAYAFDKGGKLSRELKVSGIPHAVLVDPRGKVVWKGHPSSLKDSDIEENIKGASTNPPGIDGLTKDWPDSASAAKNLLKKGKIGKALATAQKLAEKDQACKAAVDTLTGLANDEVAAVQALKEAGDIQGALDTAKEAKKTLSGCDLVKQVDELVKAIKADKDSSAIVRAQGQLAKLQAKADEIRKKKDVDSLVKKLDKLISKNPDNYPGKQAEKLKADLLKLKEKLRR